MPCCISHVPPWRHFFHGDASRVAPPQLVEASCRGEIIDSGEWIPRIRERCLRSLCWEYLAKSIIDPHKESSAVPHGICPCYGWILTR